jgi:GMC oxidoreductase
MSRRTTSCLLARGATVAPAITPAVPASCAKQAMAVVDEDLRVQGLDGLRVIDASVMPAVTSTNTNAPTIVVAEKGNAMIKAPRGKDWRRRRERDLRLTWTTRIPVRRGRAVS